MVAQPPYATAPHQGKIPGHGRPETRGRLAGRRPPTSGS